MNITILGYNAIGSFFGSILSLKGHNVLFSKVQEQKESEQSNSNHYFTFPSSCIKIKAHQMGIHAHSDFLFIFLTTEILKNHLSNLQDLIKTHNAHEIVIMTEPNPIEIKSFFPGHNVTFALPIFYPVQLQSDSIQLLTDNFYIVFGKNNILKKFLSSTGKSGIKALFVDNLESYYNSFFIFQLLSLPAALCNTTLNHFLSYNEGQKLSSKILFEGIEVMENTGKKMATLPDYDPKILLNRITKTPDFFRLNRFYSSQDLNPILQFVLSGKKNPDDFANKQLIQMAASAGIKADWNEKLVMQADVFNTLNFYPSPAELLKAVD